MNHNPPGLLHSGSMRRTGSLRGSGVFDEEKAKSTDAQNSWRRAAMSVAVEGMGGVKDMGQESAIAAKVCAPCRAAFCWSLEPPARLVSGPKRLCSKTIAEPPRRGNWATRWQ